MTDSKMFEQLGALVARCHWPDADSMVSAAQDTQSDAYHYLRAMTFVCVSTRSRVNLDDALAVFVNAANGSLQGNPRRQLKVRSFFKQCYCLYVSLRHMAVPTQK